MPEKLSITEKFREVQANNNKELQALFDNYYSGLSSENELKFFVRKVFESFYSFLYENGIRTKFSVENRKDFLEDYEKWSHGESLDCTSTQPWLFHYSKDSGYGCAASETEKAIHFEIMELCKLSLEYNEPLPEDAVIPDIRIPKYGDGFVDDIVDDGGLVCDKEPVGKTFVLTDKHGLKTKLLVERVGGDWLEGEYDYLGMGTIEGYTSSNPVKIKIFLWQGKVVSLRVYISGYDARREHEMAFRKFPLWQKFVAWMDKNHLIYEAGVEAFYEQCKLKYPPKERG